MLFNLKSKNKNKPYWEEHFSEVIFFDENGDLKSGKINYDNFYGGIIDANKITVVSNNQ